MTDLAIWSIAAIFLSLGFFLGWLVCGAVNAYKSVPEDQAPHPEREAIFYDWSKDDVA